jgi:hypothetical protein
MTTENQLSLVALKILNALSKLTETISFLQSIAVRLSGTLLSGVTLSLAREMATTKSANALVTY